MADTRNTLVQIFMVCAVLLIIALEISQARRGGGSSGSRSSGSRYSGSRYSGSRYSRTRYSNTRYSRTRYSRTRYTQNYYGGNSYSYAGHIQSAKYSSFRLPWKVALITSVYYGSSRYMTRRRYYSNSAPYICENNDNLRHNGTEIWGKFVCPLGELPDDYLYCCGEEGEQTCCRFFDDPARTAGVVIGILLLFGVVGVIIACACRHKR